MALARGRRRFEATNYWPSFVDALTTLVLTVVFLLSVFMISQFFLSQEISGRDTVLDQLNAQVAELTELLALERANGADLGDQIGFLQSNLADLEAQRDALQGRLDTQIAAGAAAGGTADQLTAQLTEQQWQTTQALNQVDVLNQQIEALRRQLAALEDALDASERREQASQATIANLGNRLNLALAQRVQELERYRSDFFARLSEILADRSDVEVVGDRFVFQSEVLFPIGSDQINPEGQAELMQLAGAVIELEGEIPADVPWVLRVDGHTDAQPITGGGPFRDNWELSAARAIAVVEFLISQGVDPTHLVAAGFGEYQPIDPGTTPEAYARNRRIELKLTER